MSGAVGGIIFVQGYCYLHPHFYRYVAETKNKILKAFCRPPCHPLSPGCIKVSITTVTQKFLSLQKIKLHVALCCLFLIAIYCFALLHSCCLFVWCLLTCIVVSQACPVCPSSQLYIWGSCYPRVTHTIIHHIRYPTQNHRLLKMIHIISFMRSGCEIFGIWLNQL